MNNDIPQNSINNYKDIHEINNANIMPAENKISRIGLITSGVAGFTASSIAHIVTISHLRGVPPCKQVLPCLGIASIGAVTAMIANRSISAVSQKTVEVAKNNSNIK
jgi:hypothetical protein